MKKISRPTNIGFMVNTLLIAYMVIIERLLWWYLFMPPFLYAVMYYYIKKTIWDKKKKEIMNIKQIEKFLEDNKGSVCIISKNRRAGGNDFRINQMVKELSSKKIIYLGFNVEDSNYIDLVLQSLKDKGIENATAERWTRARLPREIWEAFGGLKESEIFVGWILKCK